MPFTASTFANTEGYEDNSISYEYPTSVAPLDGVPLLVARETKIRTLSESDNRSRGSIYQHAVIPSELVPSPFRAWPVKEYTSILQKWEGFVVEIGTDTFTARLIGKVGDGIGREHIAEIYIREVDDVDKQLLEVGAVFYWSIGYIQRPSGLIRFSAIRMRRLPQWSTSDLERADKEAKVLGRLLDAAVRE